MKKNKVWLTEYQKELLKASEITNIKKEQESYGALGCAFIVSVFFFILSLVGMVLWFNELTIFIASGFGLLSTMSLGLALIQFKTYKQSIMRAKERIEKEEL